MIEDIIRKSTKDLRNREKARNEAYGRARRARMLSKQAILLLHNGDNEKASANFDEARGLLDEIKTYSEEFPEIGFNDAVEAAKQEYAEARILHGLNSRKEFPSPEALGLQYKDYILGLADVPGELRRQTLDLLRAGDLGAAEANLDQMEAIFLHLTGMEEASLLLKGLRRKLDVVRMVNERTRSEITTEVSRERLRKQLAEFGEKNLE